MEEAIRQIEAQNSIREFLYTLNVPAEDIVVMTRAMFNTAERDKPRQLWLLDATFVFLTLMGELPEPEPGSRMAALLDRPLESKLEAAVEAARQLPSGLWRCSDEPLPGTAPMH